MIKFNYIAKEYDICVFNRIEPDNTQTSLVIHVDDMIITASNEPRIDDVIKQIKTIYPGLTKHRGKVLSYIGMTFDFSKEGRVKMTMEGFVQDLIEGCKDIPGTANTPARANLFTVPDESDSPLPDNLCERFYSITAKLLYLSKRTRPDILTAVAFLTKRVLKPQTDDYEKLIRMIQYVRGTQHMGITFGVFEPIHVIAYIDASFAIHPDMKSHTCSVITLGKGAIFAKSGTQRLMTKSTPPTKSFGQETSYNFKDTINHQPPSTRTISPQSNSYVTVVRTVNVRVT